MSRFKRLAATPIDSLGVTVHQFEHETGASYLHFEADHPEHAFLVAFRTLPQDSTGVAHIPVSYTHLTLPTNREV